jgi:hypothetical protein
MRYLIIFGTPLVGLPMLAASGFLWLAEGLPEGKPQPILAALQRGLATNELTWDRWDETAGSPGQRLS